MRRSVLQLFQYFPSAVTCVLHLAELRLRKSLALSQLITGTPKAAAICVLDLTDELVALIAVQEYPGTFHCFLAHHFRRMYLARVCVPCLEVAVRLELDRGAHAGEVECPGGHCRNKHERGNDCGDRSENGSELLHTDWEGREAWMHIILINKTLSSTPITSQISHVMLFFSNCSQFLVITVFVLVVIKAFWSSRPKNHFAHLLLERVNGMHHFMLARRALHECPTTEELVRSPRFSFCENECILECRTANLTFLPVLEDVGCHKKVERGKMTPLRPVLRGYEGARNRKRKVGTRRALSLQLGAVAVMPWKDRPSDFLSWRCRL